MNRYFLPSFPMKKNNVPSEASKINMQWSQAMEELKKDFENQVRVVEEKLRREMKIMKSESTAC